MQYLNDQHYRTCIRAERDACYLEFQTDPNHFMLQPVEAGLVGSVTVVLLGYN